MNENEQEPMALTANQKRNAARLGIPPDDYIMVAQIIRDNPPDYDRMAKGNIAVSGLSASDYAELRFAGHVWKAMVVKNG